METSPVMFHEIYVSMSLSEWIHNHRPTSFTTNGRARVAVAFFSISLNHRQAALDLLQIGNRSAAFALLRGVFEAFVHGFWMLKCASDADYELAVATGVLPKIETMLKPIAAIEGGQILRRLKSERWSGLSDYAHGGMRQVSRWISSAGVGPVHSDAEVYEVLNMLDYCRMLAALVTCEVGNISIEPHEALREPMRATGIRREVLCGRPP